MNIKEYAGPKIFREDGSEVNGTLEIKKLYEYSGYDPVSGYWDPKSAKANSIPWIKIHNLPDHVYFNHAQHVKAGQVACQKCHGEIQELVFSSMRKTLQEKVQETDFMSSTVNFMMILRKGKKTK
jgi:hypothetical protein